MYPRQLTAHIIYIYLSQICNLVPYLLLPKFLQQNETLYIYL